MDALKEQMRGLMQQRSALEAQIAEHSGRLNAPGQPGMSDPLVDREVRPDSCGSDSSSSACTLCMHMQPQHRHHRSCCRCTNHDDPSTTTTTTTERAFPAPTLTSRRCAPTATP